MLSPLFLAGKGGYGQKEKAAWQRLQINALASAKEGGLCVCACRHQGLHRESWCVHHPTSYLLLTEWEGSGQLTARKKKEGNFTCMYPCTHSSVCACVCGWHENTCLLLAARMQHGGGTGLCILNISKIGVVEFGGWGSISAAFFSTVDQLRPSWIAAWHPCCTAFLKVFKSLSRSLKIHFSEIVSLIPVSNWVRRQWNFFSLKLKNNVWLWRRNTQCRIVRACSERSDYFKIMAESINTQLLENLEVYFLQRLLGLFSYFMCL